MRLPQTLIALLFCICTSSFSQTMIVGKVLEKGSTAPIPYVNVSLVGTTIGTSTDESGKFTLRIDESSARREIKFSSIGYISATHEIDSLLALSDEIVIELAAEVTLLGEVSVDGLRLIPRDIISHAVRSIEKNYNQHPFNAEYYSRIVTQNPTSGGVYNLESVLFGYYEGYGEKQKRKFKLLQKRESGANPIEGHLYWPSHELFQADLLSQPEQNGIFALKHIDKFQLTLEDVTLYDKDTVQVIDYVLPRPRKETTGYGIVPHRYNGKLYITTAGAIVRHIVNAPPFQFDIIYRKIGEHYYPYLIKGNRVHKKVFRINNVISLRQIELKNVQKVAANEDDWDVSKIAFNREYWVKHFPESPLK
jgi:hypothetical protein